MKVIFRVFLDVYIRKVYVFVDLERTSMEDAGGVQVLERQEELIQDVLHVQLGEVLIGADEFVEVGVDKVHDNVPAACMHKKQASL